MKQLKITDKDTSKSFTFFDNSNGTILQSFNGFEYPEVLCSIEDVSGVGGANYVTSKFGRRRMSFQGDLVGSNKFLQRRELLSALRQRGKMKLFQITTYDNLELEFEAEIVRLTMPYTHQIHSFLFEIQAPDWRFYSQDDYDEIFNANDELTVTNSGTELTQPVFSIVGPAVGVEVGNISTGESFQIDSLADGEIAVVDVLERVVTLGGEREFSIFTGDFFGLQPGKNIIEFSVASGDSPNTQMRVDYKFAYLGI
jgi:hypothetical protein